MTVKIGLVGTGTVGGGCIDVIHAHRDSFVEHYGIDIELVRVCSLDKGEAEAHGAGDIFTPNYRDLIDDPEIDIVIELAGGTTFAKTVVMEALAAGKNVVTANKALMATCGEEIMSLAGEMEREIAFEASVGGGIPIIGPLKHSLIANEVSSVLGIVNGTTNYMLTRMAEEQMDYDDVLKEAQAMGYAEADPTADVDGYDAAAKIAILSSIAFNSRVVMDDVYTEGIRNITPEDLMAAREMGYAVKLLAIGNRTEEGIDVRVHPAMLPLDHPMASVNGVFNAIYVVGDFVGETMFFGEGAGAGAAASAVMGDVLEVARHIQAGVKPLVGCTCTDKLPIVKIQSTKQRYYLRFSVADETGVLAKMTQAFANHGVSIYSMVQRGTKQSAHSVVDLVYVTHTAQEANVMSAIEEIRAMDGVLKQGSEPTVIRLAAK